MRSVEGFMGHCRFQDRISSWHTEVVCTAREFIMMIIFLGEAAWQRQLR